MSEHYADTATLQLTRRTWELLLPHLERAVDEAARRPGESFEILTELSNVRNAAYCRTEGSGDAEVPRDGNDGGVVRRGSDAAPSDDWLSI